MLRWANVKLQWLLIEAVLTHCVLGPASHSLLWRKIACWEKNLIIKIARRVVPGPPPGDGIKKILHNFIQLLPAFTKYFWLLFHPIIFVESSCKLKLAKHHSCATGCVRSSHYYSYLLVISRKQVDNNSLRTLSVNIRLARVTAHTRGDSRRRWCVESGHLLSPLLTFSRLGWGGEET